MWTVGNTKGYCEKFMVKYRGNASYKHVIKATYLFFFSSYLVFTAVLNRNAKDLFINLAQSPPRETLFHIINIL